MSMKNVYIYIYVFYIIISSGECSPTWVLKVLPDFLTGAPVGFSDVLILFLFF